MNSAAACVHLLLCEWSHTHTHVNMLNTFLGFTHLKKSVDVLLSESESVLVHLHIKAEFTGP